MEEALAALEVAAGREGTAFEVAFDCGDALRRAAAEREYPGRGPCGGRSSRTRRGPRPRRAETVRSRMLVIKNVF